MKRALTEDPSPRGILRDEATHQRSKTSAEKHTPGEQRHRGVSLPRYETLVNHGSPLGIILTERLPS